MTKRASRSSSFRIKTDFVVKTSSHLQLLPQPHLVSGEPISSLSLLQSSTMSLSASRAVLRRGQLTGQFARRYQSTTSKASEAAKDTASKAAETASEYKTKAAEGLSRVTSSAGPAIAGAAKGVSNALGRIGGRTGRFIAFVESMFLLKRQSRIRKTSFGPQRLIV